MLVNNRNNADHCFQSIAEAKNMGIFTSTPPYIFLGLQLEHIDSHARDWR